MSDDFSTTNNTTGHADSHHTAQQQSAEIVYEPLRPAIERLAISYAEGLSTGNHNVTPIHVDEMASRIAKFYEMVRKVIDWKEDSVLRRSAI